MTSSKPIPGLMLGTPDDLSAWLLLCQAPNLSRRQARKLLSVLGGAQAVAQTSESSLNQLLPQRNTPWHDAELRQRISDLTQACLSWLGSATPDGPRTIMALGDEAYPAALLETPDPPLMLFAQGKLDTLKHPLLAMVGSRSPSANGLDNAHAFAQHLAQCGWCIASGLAQGIDAQAHEGALSSGMAGRTLAVVGTGLDRVYPRQHRDLAHSITQHGLLLSEYPVGTPALPHHFPQRNRILAGLTQGTVVIEATMQSGSLITARLAAEYGREVFAIPGSIHSPQSKGCHALIKQGAKLVESAKDILGELRWQNRTPPAPRKISKTQTANPHTPNNSVPTSTADPFLERMGYEALSIDQLSLRTGLDAAQLLVKLMEHELQSEVARLPGGLFQRRVST